MSGKDPFGCDPFASLQPASSGPPPRPESPSPALPPKKSKQPPPRPAPPRPVQQPAMRAAPLPPTPSPDPTAMSNKDPFSNPSTLADPFAADPFSSGGGSVTPTPAATTQNDPFGSSSGTFADFANFDSKFSEATGDVSSQMVQATTKTTAMQQQQHRYAGLEFTEDPFRNYRYEDPFNISDPFDDEKDSKPTSASGAKLDPFGLETDSGFASEFPTPTSKMNGSTLTEPFTARLGSKAHTEIPPEDQQLAWAAAESLRLEEERRKRLEQEQADLEYALALSREEKKSRKNL
ncbi:hypothetical protein L9F63_026881 [Diploptera punctata]|uniref:Epidermal growth factor receptor substrate 15-like 1 n=1 Tax=Diploptera punctata TaxID=6984 RepID=A0AAD8AF76_DIPPU|nr:hypothetical protein L9F63_026881 [Diploptera punctata]